jgi:hypothetical protein
VGGSTRLVSGSAAGSILSQNDDRMKGKEGSEVKSKSGDGGKESGKTPGNAKGMALGTHEIWMCELVGRFIVDRTEYKGLPMPALVLHLIDSITYYTCSRRNQTTSSTIKYPAYTGPIFNW